MIDKIHWEKLLLESLFSKVAVLGTCNFIKEGSPTHVFSCEICKLFKSNYFEEHLWTSASKLYLKTDPAQVFSCEFFELVKNTYFVEDLWTAGS